MEQSELHRNGRQGVQNITRLKTKEIKGLKQVYIFKVQTIKFLDVVLDHGSCEWYAAEWSIGDRLCYNGSQLQEYSRLFTQLKNLSQESWTGEKTPKMMYPTLLFPF